MTTFLFQPEVGLTLGQTSFYAHLIIPLLSCTCRHFYYEHLEIPLLMEILIKRLKTILFLQLNFKLEIQFFTSWKYNDIWIFLWSDAILKLHLFSTDFCSLSYNSQVLNVLTCCFLLGPHFSVFFRWRVFLLFSRQDCIPIYMRLQQYCSANQVKERLCRQCSLIWQKERSVQDTMNSYWAVSFYRFISG